MIGIAIIDSIHMETRRRLFIYDRKELGVLILLGVTVALFAFTLGIHLGKRGGLKSLDANMAVDTAPVPTVNDAVPNRQELTEEAKEVSNAVDESLNQSLHEEVTRTGIRLDTPRPMELPKQRRGDSVTKTTNAAHSQGAENLQDAASLQVQGAAHSHEVSPANDVSHGSIEQDTSPPAANRLAPDGKYTLQVGSHPTMVEAKTQLSALEGEGLEPYLRHVNLKGKGQWYRIYIGGYGSKEDAEEAGKQLQSKKVVQSFIVSNRTD
jgi:cell division protein FtsN